MDGEKKLRGGRFDNPFLSSSYSKYLKNVIERGIQKDSKQKLFLVNLFAIRCPYL